MQTRCPACHTIFRVTAAQLKARAGLVRCGHCARVFNAEEHRVEATPVSSPEGGEEKKKKRARKPRTAEVTPALEPPTLELPPLLAPRRARTPRAGLWLGAAIAAALGLAVQFGYLNRDALAQHDGFRSAWNTLCTPLGCALEAPHDLRQVELLDQTRIAPHPKFDQALRIRAALVNRAPFAQPYPWMEVSLTDSNGALLARRSFRPEQYLEPPLKVDPLMPPDVVLSALLDVTNPDNRAVGYEIRLQRANAP
jgi:predicted Zn finger-like uncharacterized protein